MPDVLYINGRFTTTDEKVIGVEDRGFQFGDALYEVFKFVGKRPLFLADHYRRLASGLEVLEIRNPFPAEADYAKVVGGLLERAVFDDGIVYTQISRGEAPRSHFWPENLEPTVVLYSRAFRFPDATKKELGIKVISTPDIRWKSCHLKSVNLLGNAIAKKEAQRAGADEAILIGDGFVREGAGSSFFAVEDGRVITAPGDPSILPGTVRDHVIELALAAHIRVDERAITEYQLFHLDEAFITSTTQGVMPVTEIDGRVVGNSRRGEITGVLQLAFDELERAGA
jgi:D-alanine transaminase